MRLSFKQLEELQPDKNRQLTEEEQEEKFTELRKRIARDRDNPFFFSGWEGDTFVQKLVVNEETVRRYLEDCIRLWRSSSEDYAKYYVDAFQSAYSAIFGGTYPVEEQDEETSNAQLSKIQTFYDELCERMGPPRGICTTSSSHQKMFNWLPALVEELREARAEIERLRALVPPEEETYRLPNYVEAELIRARAEIERLRALVPPAELLAEGL